MLGGRARTNRRGPSTALFWALAWSGVFVLMGSSVAAQPSEAVDGVEHPPEAEPAPEPSTSRSIGLPNRGRMRSGVELTSTAHLAVRDGPRGATYGTTEMVGLLQRAAARVAAEHPGPRLLVGDLSRRNGGRLWPHRSHRSGRDADLSFYLLDEDGEPVETTRFVHLRRNGCGRAEGKKYCLDAARNWSLLVALLSDPIARIQYVLVTPYLRQRVLAEGERRGAPAEVLERVRLATRPHRGSHSHRSHFHVRIYCAVDDRPGCIDQPPYHEWYEGTPSARAQALSRRRARSRRAAARRAAAREAARARRQQN